MGSPLRLFDIAFISNRRQTRRCRKSGAGRNGNSLSVHQSNVQRDKEEIKTLYSPTKKGYKFLGWYTEENFINEIKDTSNQNTNLNLYAKWEIKDITITLEKDKETSPEKITGKYLEKIPKLPSPEKEGYKFLGWYDKTLENEFTKEEFPFCI